MKYIPALTVILSSFALLIGIMYRQEEERPVREAVQFNVPYIARNKIDLSDAAQLVIIDASGNITIR